MAQSKNILHTFSIDKGHLTLLQALATTQKTPINKMLNNALDLYFNTIDDKEKKQALKKYETIQAILK